MRRSWLAIFVLMLFAAFVVGNAVLWAQESTPAPAAPAAAPASAPAAEKQPAKAESMLTIVIKQSGVPGWMIIFMSVFTVYLIIRFAVELRRTKLLPEPLVTALEDDLDNKRVKEAIEKCQLSDSALARVVGSALMEIRGGYDGMVEVMEETSEIESIQLHQHVGWLSVAAAIAPMLGLLGTVWGMLLAFAQIAASNAQPSPTDLAHNIEFALITTVEGLVVAVPVLLAYAFFRNRVVTLMLEVGVVATDLIDRFKGVQITPSMLAGVKELTERKRSKPAQPPLPPIPAVGDAPPPPPPA